MMASRLILNTTLVLVLSLLVGLGALGGHVQEAQAASSTVSTISIFPTGTCCGTPNVPYANQSIFSVTVNVNILSGETVQGFDVRANYTNPGVVLRATGINYSSNVFAASSNSGPVVECLDGISVIANAAGCAGETLGQVHFAETVLGSGLAGPFSGSLFTIIFQVQGYGNSTFLFDRADITNPNIDSSNLTHFAYIPLLEQAGIFGNRGVISFFNYQPVDTTVSPFLFPNQPVFFDASGSFVANDSALGFRLYSWNFGDNSGVVNTASQTWSHIFEQPGNYTVSLTATDNNNVTGGLSRRVTVMPALGGLDLTVQDHSGNPQRQNVLVKLFNSSSSTNAFENQTVDQNGEVRFKNLIPSDIYYLTFSGQGIVSTSVTEKVIPGWTRMDTVYVSTVPPSPYYGDLIYAGTILAGIGIIGVAIVWQRRKASRQAKKSRGPAATRRTR